MSQSSLRIALLAYRGNPYSGGQGVYVRHLSNALVRRGHEVTVLAGQPYPEVDHPVRVVKLPSLDLYAEPGLFRPKRGLRGPIDALELAVMCTASFPEPLAFSLRAARWLRANTAQFDVVHDNQCLGYGLMLIPPKLGVVATIHHPVTIDRDVEVAQGRSWKRRLATRRWYGFATMQGRVARRMPRIITVSEHSREDVMTAFGIASERIEVVPNGVDTKVFCPLPRVDRVPGRIITTTSADVPLKGLAVLVEAVAKLRTEHSGELVVVGRPPNDSSTTRSMIERFGLEEAIRFTGSISQQQLVEEYASAQVAVVPSLYEGFSLPAIEAMACGVPLVATTAGALPEVAGTDGDTALLVPPGDPARLAAAIAQLLTDPGLRERVGAAGRRRVLERFTWDRAAEATAAVYQSVLPC